MASTRVLQPTGGIRSIPCEVERTESFFAGALTQPMSALT